MTRKDYELIAKVLKNSDEVADDMTRNALADMFADALEDENPRFNRETFLRACGINPIFTERMFSKEGVML